MSAILHTGNSLDNALQRLGNARKFDASGPPKLVVPSYVVKEERPPRTTLSTVRTVAKYGNGLSEHEIRRLSAAGHFMQNFGQPIFIVTEAHDADEREARKLFGKVKNHLVRIQTDLRERRNRPVPAYYAEVLEGKHAVHQNLIGVVPLGRAVRETMDRLKSSRLYGDSMTTKPVKDMNGLVRYLSKEATPQAHYALGHGFRRLKGSHPLGDGGGDRVRLSEALEADMIREGLIEPRKKTYASRALPKPAKAQKTAPYVPPVQLSLPLDLVLAEPVLQLVEERRIELKLSQRQAAQRLGIKQPAYSNAVVRQHDRLSPWAMNRARAFLADVSNRLAA